MDAPVFYASPDLIDPPTIELPSDESRHARDVMRLRKGALIVVIDGLGRAYKGEIQTVGKKAVTVNVISTVREFGEPMVHVTLAAGLSKGEKLDGVIQRATELGVSRIVPLLTEKSVIKLDDDKKVQSRIKRWSKVALASAKQCRRSVVPMIAEPLAVSKYLLDFEREDCGLFFHVSRDTMSWSDAEIPDGAKRVAVVVGPESGFSDNEAEMARNAGMTVVGLGERVLRTENAGPTAVALVMSRLGEFS